MSNLHGNRFGWSFACYLALTMLAPVARAHEFGEHREFRYCYIPLNDVPTGFLFFDPVAIDNNGRVYGTIWDESFSPFVGVFKDGIVTVRQPGIVHAANERGTMGGGVSIDPEIGKEQAALFKGSRVKLIKAQPGEFTSLVSEVNDSGTSLVISLDSSFNRTYLKYRHNHSTPLDFGPTVTNPFSVHINNQEIISGTQGISPFDGATGFRFNMRTGETTLLPPLPTEPLAWAVDINNHGQVLGYSFVAGGFERIGIWDRRGKFKTYFVEGIPEVPTISNSLLFNDNNLIVITNVSSPESESFKNSYLVPKPGIRLNLANLVQNLPDGLYLGSIRDLNDPGDMIGSDIIGGWGFLLKRVKNRKSELCTSPAATTPALSSATYQRNASPAAAAMLRRRVPPILKPGSALHTSGPMDLGLRTFWETRITRDRLGRQMLGWTGDDTSPLKQ